MNTTKDLCFEEVGELAWDVMEKLNSLDDDYVIGIVGKYKEIKEVLKEAIVYDADLGDINLAQEDLNGYVDEYLCSVESYDGEIKVYCNPLKEADKYIECYADEMYIFDNCNSRVLSFCNTDIMYFVHSGDFDDCEDCETESQCDCECCNNETENAHPGENFVINVSCNFGSEVTEQLLENVSDIFHTLHKTSLYQRSHIEPIFWW